MPPILLAAAVAASAFFAYRLFRQANQRVVMRRAAAQRQRAPVDSLIRDPETGIYRPSSSPDQRS
ncbi:MAG: hypothetical protein K2X10_12240 [Hyphomicrobiales bacterium]|nr:hypothetical protein [Hyphomicrobiales bacterium]OQW84131.1 MAG: hypothetical protein BVN31_04270 [Proteobacteria bacterium ST_bin15]